METVKLTARMAEATWEEFKKKVEDMGIPALCKMIMYEVDDKLEPPLLEIPDNVRVIFCLQAWNKEHGKSE